MCMCNSWLFSYSFFARSGGFASGWTHHAVLIDCQHNVYEDQPAGAATFPCPPLLCHPAGNPIGTHPVGGRSHATLWPVQALAAKRDPAAKSKGKIQYVQHSLVFIILQLAFVARFHECWGPLTCLRLNLTMLWYWLSTWEPYRLNPEVLLPPQRNCNGWRKLLVLIWYYMMMEWTGNYF